MNLRITEKLEMSPSLQSISMYIASKSFDDYSYIHRERSSLLRLDISLYFINDARSISNPAPRNPVTIFHLSSVRFEQR